MNDEAVFRVRIEAATVSTLRAFLDEVGGDLGCRAVARATATGVAIDAYLEASRLEAARVSRRAPEVMLTVLENQSEVGRQRQAEVGAGNRFAARGEVPRGLGRKE